MNILMITPGSYLLILHKKRMYVSHYTRGSNASDSMTVLTYLLMRWYGPDALAVVRPTGVYLLDFFFSGIQFYVLLSPYLCFISFLYIDLYVLGDVTIMMHG